MSVRTEWQVLEATPASRSASTTPSQHLPNAMILDLSLISLAHPPLPAPCPRPEAPAMGPRHQVLSFPHPPRTEAGGLPGTSFRDHTPWKVRNPLLLILNEVESRLGFALKQNRYLRSADASQVSLPPIRGSHVGPVLTQWPSRYSWLVWSIARLPLPPFFIIHARFNLRARPLFPMVRTPPARIWTLQSLSEFVTE